MLKKSLALLLVFTFITTTLVKADEGMWLPLLIKRLNYTDMQKLGLKLTADEIYSVNNSSLKDAVVNFGNFCTGEIISKDGLILTNHHCGYESIQSQSTLEHDYLTDGFWAKSRDQELPTTTGLTVSFLVRMEDVTEKVQIGLAGTLPDQKDAQLEKVEAELEKEAIAGTHYTAEVKSFFEGNEFYLFVYETYKDIRLVGAPPSSIGKFGGDTDNWMWPRHTGDFSLFRVYTGPDGKPADYSKNNIPLKAKHHLPISLKGIHKNDYAMVLGYPGNTERYLSSYGVKLMFEQTNPAKIKIRAKRLALIKEDMDASPEIRIKYSSLYAQVSNYYKYYIGQDQGIQRLDLIARKEAEEDAFTSWVNADADRKRKYGTVISDYKKIYEEYSKINPDYVYLEEAGFGPEIIAFAYKAHTLYGALKNKAGKEELTADLEEFKESCAEQFKNYNASTDKKVFAALLKMYHDDIDKTLHPTIFGVVDKKYKGDFNKYAEEVFKKSIFASQEKMNAFVAKPEQKVLDKDMAFIAMSSLLGDFRAIGGAFLGSVYARLDKNKQLHMTAIVEMRKGSKLYPDANFTMRLTYGTVQDYYPKDAVYYYYQTTLNGIMEKEDPNNEEFIVPKKLKELYAAKDYGRYADENGKIPVCFITNNDITGGNSGSPVINGEGHLIGTAFDGNWEAMSGDIVYEPELQRCISTDIRYILFIIDKYAGAKSLIDEMTIVENIPARAGVAPAQQPEPSGSSFSTSPEKSMNKH